VERRICVVTGTRADYGLLSPLMSEIAGDPALRLQVVATGMHLSPEFGLTYREIESDGFAIDAKIEMLLSSDTPVGIAKSIGIGVAALAEALGRLQPDILVLLGDRFEALAAAQAALIARIPIAHIHGGESSEGAFDESIRHAITKMAQWHFVAAGAYRSRVIQMGESPDRVFNFGAPGLDQLRRIKWLDRAALEADLQLRLKAPLFLVTYHPATLGRAQPLSAMNELLLALDEFRDATIVFTYPNADSGGRVLIELLERWVAANGNRAKGFVSLGQQRYLSLMRESDVVLGNSSSALIEAPALHKASVNVGERQAGRLRSSSVIEAAEDRDSIVAGLRTALSPEFRARLPEAESSYGSGDVSRRIKDVLKSVVIEDRKSFFDINHGL
jgi:UDP-N-acetylglucosamine 2-epimerase (non-hydrolysing)/GDP/UDP-N,N'-diacetylbacillosamine 2-epimerase (hydrolysing)